jgi:hypothetical protein
VIPHEARVTRLLVGNCQIKPGSRSRGKKQRAPRENNESMDVMGFLDDDDDHHDDFHYFHMSFDLIFPSFFGS